MNKIKGTNALGAVRYILMNFAAPITFYFSFYKFGTKTAIAFAVLVACLQIAFHWFQRQKPTLFFIVVTAFTLTFGSVDLFIHVPRFFRLEPFAQNFLLASVFLTAYWTRIPIVSRLAEDLPFQLRPKVHISEAYYQKVTLVWAFYLYLKAGIFLYLALVVNLGELVLLRSLIGGGSLGLLIFGEYFYRRRNLSESINLPSPV